MIGDSRRYARHPDTIVLLGFLLATSLTVTLTGNVSPAVQKVAPVWLALVWSGTLAVAALLSLVGALWRDPIVGWFTELIGRVGLSITSFGFSVALIAGAQDVGASIAIGFVVGIMVSSIVRARQIVRDLNLFRAALARQL